MNQYSQCWVLALAVVVNSILATRAYPQIVKAPVQSAEIEELAAVLSTGLFDRLTIKQLSILTLGCTEAELALFGPVVDPLLSHVGYGGISRRESEEAANILVRIGKPAVPSLLDGLQSRDERLRRMSANLLVRINPDDISVESELLPLLDDRDEFVLQEAMKCLETIQKSAGLDEQVTIPAMQARLPKLSPREQLWMLHILARHPNHREPSLLAMKDFLSHENPRWRMIAATRLSELDALPEDASQALLPGLKHPDAQLRCDIAGALGELQMVSDEVIDSLIEVVQQDENRSVRRNAASSLGRLGPVARRAMPALLAAIGRDADVTRTSSWWLEVQSVGRVGGADAIPHLIRYLESPDSETRQAAIQELGRLGPVAVEALPALERRLQDKPSYIGQAAARAIDQISKNQAGLEPKVP